MKSSPGTAYPLGATWTSNGVNFAIFSENATSVELLLYDSVDAKTPSDTVLFRENLGGIWHSRLPEIRPGQLYAYKVQGPFEPSKGQRFNPNKALIDPYAKAIAPRTTLGTAASDLSLFGYQVGHPEADLSFDERDSGPFVPKSVVVASGSAAEDDEEEAGFDWEGDKLLHLPWRETIIYELHVKGFTQLHPKVEQRKRGTYAGLATPDVVDYLKDLGVTAVELLPIHQSVQNKFILDKGLTNYWGYDTIGYFAPDARYSSTGVLGEQVIEFKEMVKALHQAGLEVVLDVVYNHTAEGNQLGPTLSFRGIDNLSYYRVDPKDPRYYLDFTGTGNSLNVGHPMVIRMIMDSLRYWIQEMHVDGFRFDLASTLARGLDGVDEFSTFFQVIQQDPIISQVKLIAEPWDLGPGGYQVGNFPAGWAEWNGKYRDAVRRFWRGERGQISDLAYRLTGSSDLYQSNRRTPHASVNFVTCHDGFTLHDLVSYNTKRNLANMEEDRDGANENYSWNCGVEGPTAESSLIDLRERQKRNLILTLFVSQGVQMILGGDEIGRTQGGNNNAYCQDNEVSWLDWDLDETKRSFLGFTRRMIQLMKQHPALQQRKFFHGRKIHDSVDLKDVTWFLPDGREMSDEDWRNGDIRSLGMMLAGGRPFDDVHEGEGERPQRIDDLLLVILNADSAPLLFKIPHAVETWNLIEDTRTEVSQSIRQLKGGEILEVSGRTAMVLQKG